MARRKHRFALPSPMRVLQSLLVTYFYSNVAGFAPSIQRHRAKTILSSSNAIEHPPLLNCGLLISSWTDGVVENPDAQLFLKKSLACSLLSNQQRTAEASVESSVMQSPCCGPDTEALQNMESIDKTLAAIQQDPNAIDEWLNQQDDTSPMNIKVLYIPTAMYALRADSNNTPGKQRQRARADGKKRRTQVVELIRSMYPKGVNVLTITLDLDDGSVKQPEGSGSANDFPKDGKSALRDWSPTLIYVEGGNTFWLHHCMTKGDWQDDLVSAITSEDSVYCGKSAGAILAGRTVETATWKGWDDPSVVEGMETYNDWKGIKGLDLVGGASFFPHMSDEWKELTDNKKQELGQVYCLRDEEVCLVDGRGVSIVSADTSLAKQ